MNDKVTLSGAPADSTYNGGAPQPIEESTGMHKDYWVLSESERKKGFVRPVREVYVHVGCPGPTHPLRDLTEEEINRNQKYNSNYVKFESYPQPNPDGSSSTGRYWTQEQLNNVNKGCGTETRMHVAIAESYARDPRFYGATFCVGCKVHLPVGANGEFVWKGTNERVGA